LPGGAARSARASHAPSLQHLFHLNNNKSFLKDQITLDEPSNNKKRVKRSKGLDMHGLFFFDLKGKLIILLYLEKEKEVKPLGFNFKFSLLEV
jgi:hypothetical protein